MPSTTQAALSGISRQAGQRERDGHTALETTIRCPSNIPPPAGCAPGPRPSSWAARAWQTCATFALRGCPLQTPTERWPSSSGRFGAVVWLLGCGGWLMWHSVLPSHTLSSAGEQHCCWAALTCLRRRSTGIACCQAHPSHPTSCRDGGTISDVHFRNVSASTRLYHPSWWGAAEPIYVTAVPRNRTTQVGGRRGAGWVGEQRHSCLNKSLWLACVCTNETSS